MSRRYSDDLAIGLMKALGIAVWVWLFGLWASSGASPQRMWNTLQGKVQNEAAQLASLDRSHK